MKRRLERIFKNKKVVASIILVISLAVSIGSVALMDNNVVPKNTGSEKPADLGDDYFYSESDGRYIQRGQFWHPSDSPDHFSVRYAGFSSDVPSDIKDVYVCVQDITDNQGFQFSLQMYNHENRELWFTIEDNNTALSQTGDYVLYPDNSTSSVKEMGSVVGSGGVDSSWTYTITSENIPSSLGSPEVTDTIDLRISSWEDSGYSTLYTRDNFDVKIHYVDREDAAWSLIDNDFFGSGTEGWGMEGSIYDQWLETSTEIYRSDPSCLRAHGECGGVGGAEGTASVYKSITTSDGTSSAYAIMAIRNKGDSAGYGDLEIHFDDSAVAEVSPPTVQEWHQLVVPLPENATTKFEIHEFIHGNGSLEDEYGYVDDVYFIER